MSALVRILIGIVVIVIGMSMLYKTGWYLSIMGRSIWAERNIGEGGTRSLYKLVGVGIVLIGVIILTDLWDRIVGNFIINLFGF